VFAVLMPTYVSDKVLKFPLNQFSTATFVDHNASYFSPVKLTPMTGVTMEATYTVKGNSLAGSSSTAVWNEFIYVYDQTNKVPFQTTTRTFAFDRRTAQLINCCGSNVNGDSSVEQRGYVGLVLPIGTQKQTYDVFDNTLLKPVPFKFSGEETVNGIHAYRFVGDVPPTKSGSQTLPGSLVGMSQSSVTLPQFYQNKVTYWIDPDTGALLNAAQDEKVFLENPSGQQALLLFNGNMVMTPASVKGLVAIDNDQRTKKFQVETLLPLVTGILGVILLIVGILLARKPREEVGSALTAPAPEDAKATETPEPPAVPEGTSQSAERASLVPGIPDEPGEPPAESRTAESPTVASPEAPPAEAGHPATPSAETEPPATPTGEADPPATPTAHAEAPAVTQAPAASEAPTAPQAPATAEASAAAATAPQPTAPQPARRGARHRR
jgi:hypothetical protein